MVDNLLNTYDEQRHRFHHNETVSIIVWKLDALVDRIRELEAENNHLKRTADLLAEELSTVEIPPAVCDGCRERDMFGKYSCGGKDCIYWMFSRKARGETK